MPFGRGPEAPPVVKSALVFGCAVLGRQAASGLSLAPRDEYAVGLER